MSGLELNKIAASVLVAGLIAMITGKITNAIYKPNLNPEKRGFQVEVAESVDNNPIKEEVEVDFKSLMAKANSSNGASIFKKCASCHTYEKGGPNRVGPNLSGIVGGKTAHKSDFAYSSAIAGLNKIWNEENLYHFLNNPKKFAPGTKMTFVGIKNPQDVADLIEFLKAH